MSERVKLADAEVLSALASTDYLLAERNGAIGRAAMGDNTFLTEAQRLWLEYYPKASGANIFKSADFGEGYASAWTVSSPWTLAEGLLDRVNGFSADNTESSASSDIVQPIATSDLVPGSWYTLSFWHKGAFMQTYTTNLVNNKTSRYADGEAGTPPADNGITWASSDEWTRHVLVFKSLDEITAQVRVYFRIQAGYGTVYICQPKFERGPVATPWTV